MLLAPDAAIVASRYKSLKPCSRCQRNSNSNMFPFISIESWRFFTIQATVTVGEKMLECPMKHKKIETFNFMQMKSDFREWQPIGVKSVEHTWSVHLIVHLLVNLPPWLWPAWFRSSLMLTILCILSIYVQSFPSEMFHDLFLLSRKWYNMRECHSQILLGN